MTAGSPRTIVYTNCPATAGQVPLATQDYNRLELRTQASGGGGTNTESLFCNYYNADNSFGGECQYDAIGGNVNGFYNAAGSATRYESGLPLLALC